MVNNPIVEEDVLIYMPELLSDQLLNMIHK